MSRRPRLAVIVCWEACRFSVEVVEAVTRGVARATPETAVSREAPATGSRDDGVGRRLIATHDLTEERWARIMPQPQLQQVLTQQQYNIQL